MRTIWKFLHNAAVTLMVLTLTSAAFSAPFAYVANTVSNTVTVIDTADNSVPATVSVGSGPNAVAVNPAGSRAYVANYGDDTVSVIDTATNTVVATVPVGALPSGIAVNPAGTRVYTANTFNARVSVINAVNNTVIATVFVGANPLGIAVNPTGTRTYVTNSGGTDVSVIDTGTNIVVATVAVGSQPTSIAFNPSGTRAYVTNSGGGTVSVLDTTTNAVIANVAVGTNPYGVVVSPSGARAYVTNRSGNSVSVIDTATNIVITSVPVGTSPRGIAINPAGTKVFVVNSTSNNVTVINTATNTALSTVAVGTSPEGGGKFIVPAATPAGPPIIGSAIGGNTSAIVSYSPPTYDGGSPITGYSAISSPGGFTGAAVSGPITVNGLSNGISYSFVVSATNAVGTSATSAASNSVMPSLPDITTNLQARYACDGNTLDSTANARHLATDFGVATFTANARSGSACSFNGATRLKSVTPFAFSWPVTYAFWVNDVAATSQENLMQAATFNTTSNTQNTIAIEAGSILRAFANNPVIPYSHRDSSLSGVLDSTWHHVAITGAQFRDTIQIYIDGALASTTTTGINANFDLDGTFFLGSRSDLSSSDPKNFSGKLDEIRLYDRVLTSVDIAELAAPPGITKVADTSINEDTSANNLPFTVNDLQTPAAGLTVTSTSSNPALLPNANVVLGGTGANRTVSLTPNPNASGTSTVTLTVTDGNSFTDTQSFVLTVNPVNDLPSFVVGTNQVLPPGTLAAQTISNWASAISDGDTDFTQGLSFTVTNDSIGMFSMQPAVAANGTLSFTPSGVAGRAIVSVSLADDASAGGAALSTPVQTFSIIVRGIPTVTIEQRSPAATVVGEPFSVRVRVDNLGSDFQVSGQVAVKLLISGGAPVQCTLAPIAAPPGAAEATCSNVFSPLGLAKFVEARYIGDAVFEPGDASIVHPVTPAATRLTILEDLPDPSMSNSPVAVRYLLEVLPPSLSTVASLGGDIMLSYSLSNGQVASSLTALSSTTPIALITMQGNGSNPLTASYTGDGNFLGSTVAAPEPHMLIGGNNSDLAVAISNSRRFVPIAGETTYQVRVSNLGSISSSAQLDAFVPEGLDNYRWTCSASVGSSCHAPAGNGTIVAGINILAGGNVTYTIRADVIAAEATLIRNSVSIMPALSPPDANPANDTATDTDIVAVFVEGFEE